MIACLDVFYGASEATSACVLFDDWPASAPSSSRVRVFSPVEPYEPGRFYRRELPCLLGTLAGLGAMPAIIVIDAYVWLDADGSPGLGARLYERLGGQVVVIGVAKTSFVGAPAIPVTRGKSRSPLFVSSAGIPAEGAASRIARMHGEFRIPTLLKDVDRLCRAAAHRWNRQTS